MLVFIPHCGMEAVAAVTCRGYVKTQAWLISLTSPLSSLVHPGASRTGGETGFIKVFSGEGDPERLLISFLYS